MATPCWAGLIWIIGWLVTGIIYARNSGIRKQAREAVTGGGCAYTEIEYMTNGHIFLVAFVVGIYIWPIRLLYILIWRRLHSWI